MLNTNLQQTKNIPANFCSRTDAAVAAASHLSADSLVRTYAGCPVQTHTGWPVRTHAGCSVWAYAGCPVQTHTGWPVRIYAGCPVRTHAGCHVRVHAVCPVRAVHDALCRQVCISSTEVLTGQLLSEIIFIVRTASVRTPKWPFGLFTVLANGGRGPWTPPAWK